MKNMSTWRRVVFGVLIFGLGVQGACAMNDNMPTKTICAGRFTVQVSPRARIRMDAAYHGIRVESNGRATNFADIASAVDAQEDKYSSVKTTRDAGDDAFLRAAGLNPAEALSPTQFVGKRIDSAKQRATIAYHTRPDSLDVTVKLYALIDALEWVFTREESSVGDFARDSALLTDAASRFRPISQQNTKLPGFCVMGGVFTDAGKPEIGEDMTLVVNDPAHKDMNLTVDSSDILQTPHESLRDNVDREIAMLSSQFHDMKVVGRGERSVAGQEGYFVAITGTDPDLDGARFYKYYWSTPGIPNDVTRPSLSVELLVHASRDAEASFGSPRDVTAYFDHFLQGIRVRSGAQ